MTAHLGNVHARRVITYEDAVAAADSPIQVLQREPIAASRQVSADTAHARGVADPVSRQWVDRLRRGHPRHDQTVARLHEVLLRAAFFELSRRRGQLGSVSGPEFEDLAHQAADDAVVNILAKLSEFRGLSRFTTWAYKFMMNEVSAKVARHAWRRQPPAIDELVFDELPDALARRPSERLEQQERLAALAAALGELTNRQREVFVAVALNEVSIDVLALRLGSNRNAIYKNLFDARRKLRASLAAAGHPVSSQDALR